MTKIIKDARVHYAVLKIRAGTSLVRRLAAVSDWFGVRMSTAGSFDLA